MNMERWHQLRRWLDLLPRDTVEKDPELLISEVWLMIGWPEMVEVMSRIEALMDKMASKSATFIKLQGEFDTLRSLVSYHMVKGRQSCSLAKQALEKLGCNQTSITGLAVMLLGLSYQMLGDLESAQTVVHEAIKEVNVRGSAYDARVLLTFCFMSYMEADLKGVLQSATQCLKLGQEFELGECIAHGHYFLGICHYQRNELALAEKYLLPVVKGPYVVNSHNFAYSAFALALTYQALGRTTKTQEMLDLVANYALEIRNTSLLQTAQAFQAELALRQENITETSHWAKAFDPDPFFVAYRFYVPQITHAKWLMSKNTNNGYLQATDFLLRLHDFFASSHNSSLLIEVLALQALLHDVKGDRPIAIAALEKAVIMAEPGGFIRPFIDLGSKMAALFLRLAEQKPVSEYIEKIIKAFRNENFAEQAEPSKNPLTQLPAVSTQPLTEPLTRREIEILVLLAPGLVNKEIGARLFISPETVKKHTQAIYRKLNVSNRRQAVVRAYELGLLPLSK
jgi:LuxR family maltose regulon positive regulatory protein